MRESIANSYVFSVVIIIVAVCSTLIIISMNYSKVFKIKNRLIAIIEKHGVYNNNEVRDEIDKYLATTGYPAQPRNSFQCPNGRGDSNLVGNGFDESNLGVENINQLGNYRYCIYEYKTAKGSYYQVSVFMSFEFPLIGDFIKLELPMYGDTKIIYDY